MTKQNADGFIAVTRFGLGARPGELAEASEDPPAWLRQQISGRPALPRVLQRFTSSRDRIEQLYATAAADGNDAIGEAVRDIAATQTRPELHARLIARVRTQTPFVERLVAFWSNHFTVNLGKQYTRVFVGSYEREAIRPHVFGRFADMVFAAVTHPAMAIYLDNVLNVGPNSVFGRRRDATVNENLARELLELHTVGVDGGYDQEDVEALARVMTGWGYRNPRLAGRRRIPQSGALAPVDVGPATFFPFSHEPGPKRVMGKTYRNDGPDQLREVIEDLGNHPSTARFIATKLARHFVADQPPTGAVEALATAFRDSRGDLAVVAEALIGLDAVWSEPLPKVRAPQDYIVACCRALGMKSLSPRGATQALNELGQAMFQAPSPQGWPDEASAWVTPTSMKTRIAFARALPAQADIANASPDDIADGTIGPVLSTDTARLIAGAPSGEEAIAFILASAEFQRR